MEHCLLPRDAATEVMLTGVVAAGVLLLWHWLRRQPAFYGKAHFRRSLLASALWLSGCAMEMAQTDLGCHMFWAAASWPLMILLVTSWSLFLMEYCLPTTARRFLRVKRALLIGGPLAGLVIVATNPLHGRFYEAGTRLVQQPDGPIVVYDHGLLFYLAAGYLYLFLLYALWQSLRGVVHAQPRFRAFFLGLFVITAIPGLTNAAYIGFGVTLFGFDPTPFAFSAVLVVLSWLIVNNSMMDLAAIAQHALFHSMIDPVLVLDPDGRVVEVNAGGRCLLGGDLPPGGIAADMLPWLDPVIRAMSAIPPGPPRHGQAPAAPDVMVTLGERQLSASLAPVSRPVPVGNDHMGWVVRLHDLTSHLRLQQQLNQERGTLASMMEISLSGIIALDGEGRFVVMNAEAERIMGARIGEGAPLRIDDPAWDIRTPRGEAIEDLGRIMADFLGSGQAIWDQRFSIMRRADGERRILSLNANALQEGKDKPTRIVLSLADITERYHAEIRLREAAERAEAANRAKSQFLANMSHEIRTPLNGVLGMADVLTERLDHPDHRRMALAIRDSGLLLLSLLNDILDMAKIESGKLVLEARPVQAGQLAERIQGLFDHQASQKGLDFDVFLSAAASSAPWMGDALRVQQILQNLVSNAIKFTSEGEVRVGLSADRAGALVIEVADTGIGMTPEQVSRIFDEFEQADGTTTRRFGGSGLGMSIVRRLADLMGGQVTVVSAPDEGTTVRVVLPLARAESAGKEAAAAR